MTEPRSIGAILGELRALHSLQADAHTQLRSVQRQQTEMASFEASILAALDGRARKIDRLLDEYTALMAEKAKMLR